MIFGAKTSPQKATATMRVAAIILVLCCCGASDGFQVHVARAPVAVSTSTHPRRAIVALNLADGDDETTIPEAINAIELKRPKEDADFGDNTLAGVTNKLGAFFLSLCIFLLPFFATSPALAVQSGGRMGGSFSGSSSRSSSSRSYSTPSRGYGGSSYSSGLGRGYSSGLSSGYSRPSVTVVSPSYYRR